MAQYKLTQTGSEIQDILNKADKLPATVGTNGQVLTSDGTDLLWQTPSSTENINFNDTTTTATDAVLNNIVVGNSIDGYTRYIVPEGGANIVEVESVNVTLSESVGAAVQMADGLTVSGDDRLYWKSGPDNTVLTFQHVTLLSNVVYKRTINYNTISRSLTLSASNSEITTRDKVAPGFSSATSYSPGDLVWYNNNLYRCIVAHTGSWSNDDFTQTVLSDEIHSDIVTISATGVQSDAMAAKILNAKALYYDNKLFSKSSGSSSSTYIEFTYARNVSNQDYHGLATYEVNTKTLLISGSYSDRVTSIDGKRNAISIDSSLKTTGTTNLGTLGLTGKLPYLDIAPSADNTSGFLTIVVLSAEPATRYNGYLYIITAAAQ